MIEEFERQNVDLMGEKTSGLVTADTHKAKSERMMEAGGASGDSMCAGAAEPSHAPPASTEPVTEL